LYKNKNIYYISPAGDFTLKREEINPIVSLGERMKKLVASLVMVCGLLFIVNVIIDAAQANESYYGEIARDFMQNPDKYSNQNSLSGTAENDWDLKFSEPNITGDTGFGHSVACAGDVNGDGYDDVLVGANYYNNERGRAYLYYGGPDMDADADLIMTGDTQESDFACSVAGAGDVNGDGYADIIIGANSAGTAYLYLGGANPDNIADVVMSQRDEPYFGDCVSGAGDVNGDGYCDVMIVIPGGRHYRDGYLENEYTGYVYLYYGGQAMDNIADVVLAGETPGDNYAGSIAGVGDVNGDGYADVLVGAYYINNYTGRMYLYYGNPNMDATADVVFYGKQENSYFGATLTGAGDVNNDGYDDILVGAYKDNSDKGHAYIYYGGTAMDNTVDIMLSAQSDFNYFGSDVAGAGDVNNDGYDDILIGACFSFTEGRAYLYYGSAHIDNNADIVFTEDKKLNYFCNGTIAGVGDVNDDGYADISIGISGSGNSYDEVDWIYILNGSANIDKTADLTLTGETVSNGFGYSVADAGDVNNDGYHDVLIGAISYCYETGQVYLYYGGPDMDTIPDIVMTGEDANNYFGYSVAGAGDVNGDGYDDVLVGAYRYENSDYWEVGRAYLYLGGSNMDGKADIVMTGEAPEDYYDVEFGYKVAGAGDVNGDGYDDILISARCEGYNINVYLFYGGAAMDNIADAIIAKQRDPISIYSLSWNEALSGVGDVNQDGYDDILIGECVYSEDKNIVGRAYLYYGGVDFDNEADVIFTGELDMKYLGRKVASAGDVNNDGFLDLLIGCGGYKVNLYFGGPDMDTSPDLILDGAVYGKTTYYGESMTGGVDINHDGYDDVVVGAYGYATSTGRAYIYYGGPNMDDQVDGILTGIENSCFGFSLAALQDVNGDGFSELLVGAPYYGEYYNGDAYLYFGSQTLDVEDAGNKTLALPNRVQLWNNYPNPFNPATNIEFELPARASVEVVVYDVSGRRVRKLLHEWRSGGQHRVTWDGRDDAGLPVSRGVYLCRFSTDTGFAETKKMTLVK